MTQSRQFLEALFGDSDKYFLLWTLPGGTSLWFRDVDEAEAKVHELVASNHDVYVGCGLSPEDVGPKRRCKAADIAGIVGLWADIDVAGDEHAKKALPPTIEDARGLVDSMGLKPTFLVMSGHGLHAWWLFNEPWIFEDDSDRKAACDLVLSWGRTLRNKANAKKWSVDSVFDLSRILRVPGTMNRKDEDNPTPVSILEQNDIRYNPSDFDDYVSDYATSSRDPEMPISGLIYDIKRGYNKEKFFLLMENDDRVRPTWLQQRSDLKNQDQSTYDMALGNLVVPAGWTNQEIADLLVFYRDKCGAKSKNRDSYIAKTIAKVRADFDGLERKKPASVREIEERAAEILTVSPEEREDKREEILEMVSRKIGVQVLRVIKYRCDPPAYELITDRGSVRLPGIEMLSCKAKFVNSLAQTIDFFVEIPNKEWLSIKNALLACIEVEEMDDDLTEAGETRSWLRQYLDEALLVENWWETGPWRDPKDGGIRIKTTDMHAWLERRFSKAGISSNALGIRLEKIGATKDHRSGRDDSGRPISKILRNTETARLYAN